MRREHSVGDGMPLVVFIGSVPLAGEAVRAALDEVADVRLFPARRGDTMGLLRSLRPDAIVVDSDDEAAAATPYASEAHTPLIHVRLRKGQLRVFAEDAWEEPEIQSISGEAIRNAVVGHLFARGRAR
jgi:hypothetical protein